MWAQYAENHRGVCLVFDREELNLLLKNSMPPEGKLRAASVHYIDYSQDISFALDPFILSVDEAASKGLSLHVKEMLEKRWFDYFFVKMQDWRDESEFKEIYNVKQR